MPKLSFWWGQTGPKHLFFYFKHKWFNFTFVKDKILRDCDAHSVSWSTGYDFQWAKVQTSGHHSKNQVVSIHCITDKIFKCVNLSTMENGPAGNFMLLLQNDLLLNKMLHKISWQRQTTLHKRTLANNGIIGVISPS